ncbi:ABC transporter ATP-binding protein [Curtobacterium sp. DN_7.5]|uniref:ABC transporter ATP-binding protein n=1 Tax=Curtobacterium sp. DN_7.5 TaxID=3049047 RepID=UPI001F5899EC|nr:ABC transporter ATP-binding protein [Curtobacterium sp. DN_7.5]
MLEIDAVTKRYGRAVVLDSVTSRVREGEVAALAGPNGAGKSTLIHVITGLTRPTRGRALLDGVPVLAGRRRDVGFCPDDLPIPELLTGHEYLDLAEALHGTTLGRRHRRRLLDCLHLDAAASRLIGTYSHGMKRKLQLLAAVARRPRLLVLDEPLRGLDPESGALLRAVIRDFADQGGAVLLSTHDLASAQSIASRLLVLQRGKLLTDVDVDAIAGKGQSLETAFLEITGIGAAAARSSERFLDAIARADQWRC